MKTRIFIFILIIFTVLSSNYQPSSAEQKTVYPDLETKLITDKIEMYSLYEEVDNLRDSLSGELNRTCNMINKKP